MSFFDQIEEEFSSPSSYFDIVEEEFVPSVAKDIGKQGAKGVGKGLFGAYGNLLDLIRAQPKKMLPGEKIQRGREEEALERIEAGKPSLSDFLELGEDEVIPRYSKLPSSSDVEDFLSLLSINPEAESGAGRFAERIGEALGGGAALGGSPATLAAMGGGAALGQGAEELGASPMLSALVELGGSLGLGGIGGKVAPFSKEGQKLAAGGRALGLTEKELSPLVKSKAGFGAGTTLTRKTQRLNRLANSIESKLGKAFKGVEKEAQSYGNLSGDQAQGLVNKLSKSLEKLKKTHNPSEAEKTASSILEEAIKNIDSQGSSYEKLVSSYRSINKMPKAVRNALEPVKKAYASEITKASPKLAQEFLDSNKLYSQFMDRVSRLRPESFDKMINKVEALGISAATIAAMLGHPWALKGIIGEAALRSVAKEYLTNPYFQNLPNKVIQATKKGNWKAIESLAKEFEKKIKEEKVTKQ